MKKEVHAWRSPNLGLDMPIAVYGHWGVPMLFFPTASADFEEYERYGLIDAISEWIDKGVVKVYSINSVNDMGLFNESLHPDERARRQQLFDQYVIQEVAPFIHANCQSQVPIATMGPSMGAFHALNTVLKHPHTFQCCIGMSGFYDIGKYVHGATNPDAYYNNPPHYMRELDDHQRLEAIRSCSINLIVGQGPWEHVDWTSNMAQVLWDKGVPCNMDLWGHDVAHDWPWWKIEMNEYIPRLFGRG